MHLKTHSKMQKNGIKWNATNVLETGQIHVCPPEKI